MDIRSAEVWDKLWQETKGKDQDLSQEEAVAKSVERWNKRADSFADSVMGTTGSPRVQKVIAWLEDHGVELDGMDILDIGSGPGAFALPLSTRAKRVIALEPAGEMANLLEARVREERIANIGIVREAWEDISLEGKYWAGMYDIVFASMSPGINDLATLTKAIDASKRFVYISSHAGKKEYEALADLWPQLFDRDFPKIRLDIQHTLNIVYALGYSFHCKIWEEKREQEKTIEDATDFLFSQMRIQADDAATDLIEADLDKYRQLIEDYVTTRSEDGKFIHRSVARMGAILIDKNM